MDQLKLFFNVSNDLWKFAKTELTKKKSEMDDDDWERVYNGCCGICNKYNKLGEREQTLVCSIFSALLEYIDREDKEKILDSKGHYYWKKVKTN